MGKPSNSSMSRRGIRLLDDFSAPLSLFYLLPPSFRVLFLHSIDFGFIEDRFANFLLLVYGISVGLKKD